MRKRSILLLLIVSMGFYAWKSGGSVAADEASYTLYGTSELGWGFTNQTMTIPGPELSARQGETVRIRLIAALEPSLQVIFPHDFGVDYDGDCQPTVQPCLPSPGEPWSGYFGGGSPNPDTVYYNFTTDATPGNYTYYCYVHAGTMLGNFIITEPGAPAASFSFSPASPMVGQTVSFDGSNSSDPDGTITSYGWLFGDGGSGSGIMVNHTYSNPGTWPVTLTVKDDTGLIDRISQSIIVTGPGNQAPVAIFSFNPPKPILGQAIVFDGSNSLDPDQEDRIEDYSWDFGDGFVLTSQTPTATHVYSLFGTFQVSLTVTDSRGLSSQNTTEIDVLPIRNVSVLILVLNPVSLTLGDQVNISATIANLGNKTEVFQIQLRWNSTQIATWPASVAASELLAKPYNWTPPSPGVYVISVRVLVSLDDQNYEDNEMTVTLRVEARATGLPGVFYWSLGGTAIAAVGTSVYFYRKRRLAPKAPSQH